MVRTMTPKKYLEQIQELEWSIYVNQEAIQRVKDRMDIKGLSYDKDRVQTSPQDTMPDLIANLIRLEEVTDNKRIYLEEMMTVITNQIELMENVLDKKILYMRYVKGLSLYAVSKKLHYSYDYIRHRHGMALQRFEKKHAPLERIAHNSTF